MSLMSELMVHAPESVHSEWALYNHVVPTEPWPNQGPSVEVGMAMVQKKTAYQVAEYVKNFTNPDLLDEIARTDDRVRVAHALVENGNLSFEGYKALLETHGRRTSIIKRINEHGTPLRVAEMRELNINDEENGILNDARAVGVTEAVKIAFKHDVLPEVLLHSYVGTPTSSTPRATHADILEAFELYYSKCDYPTDFLCVPHGTERWIVEVPGAAERMLTAIVEGASYTGNSRGHRLMGFLENLPTDLNGPVPDVHEYVKRGDEGNRQQLRTASNILTAWFERRPATAAELSRFHDLLAEANTGDRFLGYRSQETPLYVSPEVLLADDVIMPHNHVAMLKRPVEAALRVLRSDDEPGEQFRKISTFFKNGAEDPFTWMEPTEIDHQVQELSKEIISKLRSVDVKDAAALMASLTRHSVVWSRICHSTNIDPFIEFFADWVMEDPDAVIGGGMTRDQSERLRDLILKRMYEPSCDDASWDLGLYYLLNGTMYPFDLLQQLATEQYDRFFRVMVKPALDPSGESSSRAHTAIVSQRVIDTVIPVAIAEYEAGDPTRLDELLELIKDQGGSQVKFSVRRALATTERGMMSGAFNLKELLSYSETAPVLARLFTEMFGDDTSRWQVAVDLAEDWEGTLPELLEVVEAAV